MNLEEMCNLESKMWEAAKNRNSKAFLEYVSEDAVMVCGGFRCLGQEYAEIVSEFDCKDYKIENFEIVSEDVNSIQVHYIIETQVHDDRNRDLAGKFHITTTWKQQDGVWKVVFNMDQRIFE